MGINATARLVATIKQRNIDEPSMRSPKNVEHAGSMKEYSEALLSGKQDEGRTARKKNNAYGMVCLVFLVGFALSVVTTTKGRLQSTILTGAGNGTVEYVVVAMAYIGTLSKTQTHIVSSECFV